MVFFNLPLANHSSYIINQSESNNYLHYNNSVSYINHVIDMKISLYNAPKGSKSTPTYMVSYTHHIMIITFTWATIRVSYSNSWQFGRKNSVSTERMPFSITIIRAIKISGFNVTFWVPRRKYWSFPRCKHEKAILLLCIISCISIVCMWIFAKAILSRPFVFHNCLYVI